MRTTTKARRSNRTPRVSNFSRQLLSEWRTIKLPLSSEAILVGVSGGADSTALLLAIHELIDRGKLSLRVTVAHLDHGLRAASRKDAKWVSQLARELGFEAVIGHTKVKELAREDGDNLEQAARRARYEFFLRTAKRKGARFVLAAHTMDDQAETVLLRLMRGSASIGLSGMESLRPIEKGSKIQLARPLLWARRSDTEGYCRSQKREFLVDEMNSDDRFARVKVRKQLLPLMQSFNNRIVDALSRTATLLREDSAVLFSSASELLRLASENLASEKSETKPPALNVSLLVSAPPALRRRALRQWISEARGDTRRLEMVHLLAVEALLEGGRGGRIAELPNGGKVRRRQGWLELDVEND
jgi:tRNA(Ile)-lysidine synthase